MHTYDKFGKFHSSTIVRRFNTWNNALRLINRQPKQIYYSTNELLDNIRDAWLIKGAQPTRRDMDNRAISRCSSGAYIRKFGSWYNALDAFVQYIYQDNDSNMQSSFYDDEIKHKTQREPSNRLKVQVLMRDGNRCRLCGIECNDGLHNIQFDHIIPWSKGGETTLDNLQVLCHDCNLAKGNI